MDLRVATATDRGLVRDNNEDAVLDDLPLVAVADGMGGHQAGEVASSLALDVLRAWKERIQAAGDDVVDCLRQAFDEANRVVSRRGREDERLRGMGTTLTAAFIRDRTAVLAHVGDSRAYLLRGAELRQLTEDQNLAQEWVRRGRISQAEAATSPQRHMILQSIGGPEEESLQVAVTSVELHPGDRLLLATDGLHGMVSAEAIRKILTEYPDPGECCRALVDAANNQGGADNVSVVVVDLDGPPQAGAEVAPVVVQRPVPPRPPRHRPPRLLVAGVGVAALVVAALLVIVRSSSPQYVLASRGSRVVVLRGRPGTGDRPATGRVVRVFEDEPIDRINAYYRRQLRTGIVVPSLAAARARVANLPHVSPTPSPRPSPSPTPAHSVPPPSSPLRPTRP